jgi:hypothetical protein
VVEGWIGSTGLRQLSGRNVVEHMAVVGVVVGCLEIPLQISLLLSYMIVDVPYGRILSTRSLML